MKKLFLLGLLISLHCITYSQDSFIKGQVIDSDATPLPSATVVILSEKDSSIVSFALTNNEGAFDIDKVKLGTHILQVSYLGFDQYSKSISLSEDGLDLGSITMSTTSNQLEQIEIKGEHVPLMVKKDTIEYNAAAFQTQPNEVVEDLLKKMPGIEVDDDGTITAQGEEVEQVLVDGKEFFGTDPKIATKNLPAEAVDKIQFFDKKSDVAEFTGVDDGERAKTMNLELKEDYKSGYFGTVSAGAGADDNENFRHASRLSLNRFSPKMKLSVIGNVNNVNQQGFSIDQYMSMMNSMGGFSRGRGSGINISGDLSNGFVNTIAGGVNMNYDFTDKTKLNINYLLSDIDNDVNQITTRENLLTQNRSYIEQDSSQVNNHGNAHTIKSRLEHEIDSTQNIQIDFNYSLNNAESQSQEFGQIFNFDNQLASDITNGLESNTTQPISDWSGSFLYRKRFGRRSMALRGQYGMGLESIRGEFYSTDFINDFNSFDLLFNSRDDDKNYSTRLTYIEPLGVGKSLEFNYRRQNFQNDFSYIVEDILLGEPSPVLSLSNLYDRDFTYDRVGVGYHFSDDVSSLSIDANFQFSNLTGDVYQTLSKDVSDTISFKTNAFLPGLRYRYEIDRGHNIRFTYSTSVNEPSIEQLQPREDISDPQNIYIGNSELIPEYRHRARLNYVKWDQFTFRSIFAFLTATYTRNKITNQTLVGTDFIRTTSPINVVDDFSARASVSFSSPIRSIGMKYRLRTSANYNNNIVFINGLKNDANRYVGTVGLNFENRNKEKVDFEIGTNYSYNTNFYSELPENNQSFFNQTYNSSINVTAVKNWTFRSSVRVRVFDQQQFGEAQTVPIWNASVSRYFLNGNSGELRLSVQDILNRNIGISRTSTLNYIENEEINSLGRYIMLSFLYTPKKVGANNGGNGGGRRSRVIRG